MFGRVFTMLIKEFIELRRDVWALFRLTVPPIIQIVVFGYAATFEVFGVSTTVLDLDHSQESRDLVSRFAASGRFQIVEIAQAARRDHAAIDQPTRPSRSSFRRLRRRLRKGRRRPCRSRRRDQFQHGADRAGLRQPNRRAVQQISRPISRRLHAAQAPPAKVALEPRPWYNVDLNSRWFFVPGVIATLTLVMVVNLTAFAVVREREVGTLEQIMVTPIRPFEFILGKTMPFFFVGLALVA